MPGRPNRPSAPIASWRRRGLLGVAPAFALLSLLFVLPVLGFLLRGVLEPRPGLQNFAEMFATATYLKVFANTFLVAALVTVATLALGFPVAWFLAIASPFWSQLVFAIVVLSMWTNLLTRTYAWMVLLQDTGLINRALLGLGLISAPLPLINNLTGVVIGMTYILLPFMVLPLHAAIRTLDADVFRAASLCGASRGQTFRLVFLPLIRGGVGAGALMVFVMALGFYITPSLLGGAAHMMLAELIAELVQSLLNWGLGAAAAFALLSVTLALYALQLRWFGLGAPQEAR